VEKEMSMAISTLHFWVLLLVLSLTLLTAAVVFRK
jgi:hypothetical protein